jgi:hypothetical protein
VVGYYEDISPKLAFFKGFGSFGSHSTSFDSLEGYPEKMW